MAEKSRLGKFGHFALHTLLHSFLGTPLHPVWAPAWSAVLSALVALWALLKDRDPLAYAAMGFFGAFALLTLINAIARFVQGRRANIGHPSPLADSGDQPPPQSPIEMAPGARHQADQAAIVGLQSSLEEAETRINGLESSCATERDSTAAARRDVARLAAKLGQASVATAIVARYSRLKGATAEEQDRLLFGIDNACQILLKDTGDQEVHAACEEIRAVCIMDQPPIEQLEEPVRKLAAHYFGPEALPV